LKVLVTGATGFIGSHLIERLLARGWLNRITNRVAGVRLPRVDSIAFLTSDRTLDLSLATKELGYAPRIGVHETVAWTADWGRSEELL
jgi:nucleoside-diphosphate-sugar epimerase